jgi:peptidoglycan/LPS O-acetylase OafA/YrhL
MAKMPEADRKDGHGELWPATQLAHDAGVTVTSRYASASGIQGEGDCMGGQHRMTDIPRSAPYSAGTSSLLQGEAIPESPLPVPSSRQQFRPDIEGMRAIAVALVILFHAFHQPFTGGFVGVDVFFVISGFLITSLLLKEREKTDRISITGFYARRVRRILPASTLVVLVTLFATYGWLGFINGNNVANDAKWTEIFAANIHFGLVGTDYFGAQLPPSPLQHMWSLGVEEQFYVVWPGLFLVLIVFARGAQHRKALAAALLFIIAASLTWSVIQTAVNQTWAYFSPLTRAWELALGALVAVLAPTIGRLRWGWAPQALAFAGLAGIAIAAVLFTADTRYPGFAVALPVVGSAALIAAGCGNQRTMAARALSARPMQWAGARSYSMYLWHWPLLIIPAQYATKELSAFQNAGWVLLTVVASAITYRLVENPVRRARVLTSRTGLSLTLGALLVGVTIFLAQWQIASHYGTWNLFS